MTKSFEQTSRKRDQQDDKTHAKPCESPLNTKHFHRLAHPPPTLTQQTVGMPSSRRMGSLKLLILAFFALATNALYFYMDAQAPKCFHEELPKDTLIVGHYETAVYNEGTRGYTPDSSLQIHITIDEIFDDDHRVVSNMSPAKGRFTYTAADSGDHKLCFRTTNAAATSGWLSGGLPAGGIRFTLDLAIGETSDIESNDKSKVEDLVTRVRDLNSRLEGIKREQVFQREREAEFRDQSESTNSRAVKWTLIQLVVLGVTCAWQLTHLRAFFIKQKLT